MAIKVKNIDDSISFDIYAKAGKTTCKEFSNGMFKFISADDIVSNNLYIHIKDNSQELDIKYFDYGNTRVKVKVIFIPKKYFFGIFITFLGLGVLIQSFFAIKNFIKRRQVYID